jgi:hypothetical protein
MATVDVVSPAGKRCRSEYTRVDATRGGDIYVDGPAVLDLGRADVLAVVPRGNWTAGAWPVETLQLSLETLAGKHVSVTLALQDTDTGAWTCTRGRSALPARILRIDALRPGPLRGFLTVVRSTLVYSGLQALPSGLPAVRGVAGQAMLRPVVDYGPGLRQYHRTRLRDACMQTLHQQIADLLCDQQGWVVRCSKRWMYVLLCLVPVWVDVVPGNPLRLRLLPEPQTPPRRPATTLVFVECDDAVVHGYSTVLPKGTCASLPYAPHLAVPSVAILSRGSAPVCWEAV